MTDSCGSRSNSARATVSPPIPESKTPSGASFMERNADADAAGEGAYLEIGREVLEMARHIGFGAREEVIEHPQDEPVLHFLALEPKIARMNLLEVVRFLLGLERHHRRHTFPCHERGARHRPAGRGLAPARKNEGAQKGSHRPNAVVHGVGRGDDVGRVSDVCGILGRQSDGRTDRQCDDGEHSSDRHCATNTFSLPRFSSTVHSYTPGSRNSPSRCSTSGASGERTTSVAVLTSATSRIVTCVPRMTRGI